MPELKGLHKQYKSQGLVLIGVHCDDWNRGLSTAKKHGIDYPITNDNGEKSQDVYKINGYPTVYVIDKKGIVRYVDPDDLEARIKGLLREKA